MAEPADALVLGSRAFELLLTARTVDAEEALRLGLVAAVTEPGTPALDRALELADTLCGYSPFGVAMTKEVMWSNLDVLARPAGRRRPPVFDLSGKVALVTGAGQGVGEGIARALAAQGATVLVNDLNGDRAGTVAEAIVAAGGAASPVSFDVTDLDAVLEAVGRAGPVDVLVNNAGNGGAEQRVVRPFRELDPAAWEGPIRVNLFGVLHCCKAVVDGMCDRGWGRIITISSGAGTAGVAIGVSPYSAGKGGGIGFTRTLALEVASYGVTANTLAIGLMGMPDPSVTAALARRIPVGRTGEPEDIAAACVWLASDEASWVTAQTIQINGGSITT